MNFKVFSNCSTKSWTVSLVDHVVKNGPLKRGTLVINEFRWYNGSEIPFRSTFRWAMGRVSTHEKCRRRVESLTIWWPKVKIQKCLQNLSLYWAKLIYYSTFESSILRLKLGNWRNSQYKETHMDRYFKMSCQISVYNLILIEFFLPKRIDIPFNYHLSPLKPSTISIFCYKYRNLTLKQLFSTANWQALFKKCDFWFANTKIVRP